MIDASKPLENAKHERYITNRLEGRSIIDAHEKAGYARGKRNAMRLNARPVVQARMAHLNRWRPRAR